MSWNCRVMRKRGAAGDSFSIHEVHYDKNKVCGWTKTPVMDGDETLDALKKYYKLLAEAFDAPVLDYKTGKPIKG